MRMLLRTAIENMGTDGHHSPGRGEGPVGSKQQDVWDELFGTVSTISQTVDLSLQALTPDTEAGDKVSATTKRRLFIRSLQGLKQSKDAIQLLTEHLKALQAASQQWQRTMMFASKSHEELMEQLESTNRDLHLTTERLRSVEAQRLAAVREAEAQRALLGNLEGERKALQAALKQRDDDLETAQFAAAEAQAEVAALKRSTVEAQQVARDAEAARDRAVGALDGVKGEAAKASAAAERHQEAVAKLTADNLVFLMSLRKAEAELAAANEERNALRLAAEKQRGPWFDEVRASVEERVRAAMARAEGLERELEVVRAAHAQELQDLSGQKSDLEEFLAQMREKEAALEKSIAEAHAARANAELTAAAAMARAEDLQGKLEALSAENRVLQENVRGMRQECTERWVTEQAALGQVAGLKDTIAGLEAAVTSHSARVRQLEASLDTQLGINKQLMSKKEEVEWQLMAAMAKVDGTVPSGGPIPLSLLVSGTLQVDRDQQQQGGLAVRPIAAPPQRLGLTSGQEPRSPGASTTTASSFYASSPSSAKAAAAAAGFGLPAYGSAVAGGGSPGVMASYGAQPVSLFPAPVPLYPTAPSAAPAPGPAVPSFAAPERRPEQHTTLSFTPSSAPTAAPASREAALPSQAAAERRPSSSSGSGGPAVQPALPADTPTASSQASKQHAQQHSGSAEQGPGSSASHPAVDASVPQYVAHASGVVALPSPTGSAPSAGPSANSSPRAMQAPSTTAHVLESGQPQGQSGTGLPADTSHASSAVAASGPGSTAQAHEQVTAPSTSQTPAPSGWGGAAAATSSSAPAPASTSAPGPMVSGSFCVLPTAPPLSTYRKDAVPHHSALHHHHHDHKASDGSGGEGPKSGGSVHWPDVGSPGPPRPPSASGASTLAAPAAPAQAASRPEPAERRVGLAGGPVNPPDAPSSVAAAGTGSGAVASAPAVSVTAAPAAAPAAAGATSPRAAGGIAVPGGGMVFHPAMHPAFMVPMGSATAAAGTAAALPGLDAGPGLQQGSGGGFKRVSASVMTTPPPKPNIGRQG